MKLSDKTLSPPKILLYGPPGTQKTLFLTTLGESLQLLDLDRGLNSALRMKDPFTAERGKVDVLDCWEENPASATAFSKVRSYVQSIGQDARAGRYKWKVLGLDSLSALAEMALRHAQGTDGLGKPLQIQHYGIAFQEIGNLFLALRALPLAVVVTAHSRRLAEGDTDGTREVLAVPGKDLYAKLPAYFDELWHTRVRRGAGGHDSVVLETTQSPLWDGKTRGGLPNSTDTKLGLREVLAQIGFEIGPDPKQPRV